MPAGAVIQPGAFQLLGPTPLQSYQAGQQQQYQLRALREKAQLTAQRMQLDQALKELELESQWKMTKEKLSQERELEGEKTKREEAYRSAMLEQARMQTGLQRSQLEKAIAAIQLQQLREAQKVENMPFVQRLALRLASGLPSVAGNWMAPPETRGFAGQQIQDIMGQALTTQMLATPEGRVKLLQQQQLMQQRLAEALAYIQALQGKGMFQRSPVPPQWMQRMPSGK